MDRRAAWGRKLGVCWDGLAECQPRWPRPQAPEPPNSAPGLPPSLTLQHTDHTCWPHPGHVGEAQGIWGAQMKALGLSSCSPSWKPGSPQ